jgi:predicted kinase
LIVLAGLPGAGKSTVAALVADRLGAVWLRVDTLEASMLRAGLPRSFETGLAAYIVARDVAREQLGLRHDVVIDAVNGVEEARQMWRELARECAADRYVLEVVCPDPAEHRRRVESRPAPTPPLPAPTWEEVLQREYLPWREPTLSLDGRRPPEENLRRVRAYLRRGRAGGPSA